jgi:hypothetical protein
LDRYTVDRNKVTLRDKARIFGWKNILSPPAPDAYIPGIKSRDFTGEG